MPIDHAGIHVAKADMQAARDFYLAALKPLGYVEVMSMYDGAVIGMGANYKPDWWLLAKDQAPNYTSHVAFTAPDRKTVDAFHAAALEAGAKDNGAPGLRPTSHPNYYGAYVLDPVGNNIEVVCHAPE